DTAEQPAAAAATAKPPKATAKAPPELDLGPRQELAPEGATVQPAAAAQAQTTAVATVDRTRRLPAAQMADAPEGMEGVDSDDLVIPKLKIKQAQTKDRDGIGIDDVEHGNWFLSNDPESATPVRDLVFLAM